jgi:hypothetical protein
MLRVRACIFALVTFAACSIPQTAFHASIDAGAGADSEPGSDAIQVQPGVLAIVASATALQVDEGATKDFTVALSQAPDGPLTVSIATTATTKLGISAPTLTFTPTNFGDPQTVTVSGLADVDTTDDQASVTLTAAGVDPVTIATTVHDLDKLAIIASGDNPVMIQEGGTVTVNVHLSAQPPGDVAVSALLGTGPVTVAPAMRVFTAANYDVDQVFTFSAPLDADTLSTDQSLTFRAASVADKPFTIHDIDINAQNILVQLTPGNAMITEATTTATLDVSLSQKPGPGTNVTVMITTTTGAASIDKTAVSFNETNYAVKQTVTISAPADPDTVDGSDTIKLQATDPDNHDAALDRTVAITIKDNDVQKILENAPSPLAVTETTSAVFAAALQFKPTTNVVVNVVALDSSVATASPGTLTFTPADYDQPHNVTVTGVHDNNLVPGTTTVRLSQAAIGTTDVAVNVADVDQQAFVLSATTVAVTEGTSRTFDVSLKFDPGATTTATVTNSNPSAFPSTPSSITFTGGSTGNWATPVHVTMTPPIDNNNTAETATFTLHTASAPDATVVATMVDPTVVAQYGNPPPAFSSNITINRGTVMAIKIAVPVTTRVDSLAVNIPAGAGDFRMALYNDAAGAPGQLVAFMPVRQAIVAGANIGNLAPDSADPTIPVGTYWLAIRIAQTTAISQLPTPTPPAMPLTAPDCFADATIQNLDFDWPNPFGDHSCQMDNLMNLWINTYHQ